MNKIDCLWNPNRRRHTWLFSFFKDRWSFHFILQVVFPEMLLIQLLKVMLHPDVEVRIGGHHIFSVLLNPNSNHTRQDVSYYANKWHSSSSSTFHSITALLEKLRKGKDGSRPKNGITIQDDFRERDSEEECHQGWAHKNSPNFQKISSMVTASGSASSTVKVKVFIFLWFPFNLFALLKIPDMSCSFNNIRTHSWVQEPSVLKFNEDQIAQVLSALWIQASLPDNRHANIEAIAHSFCLTLISSDLRVCNRLKVFNFYCLFFPLVYKYIKGKRTGSVVFSSLLVLGFMSMQNLSSNLIVSFFHFPLAIMKMSVDPNQGNDYYIFLLHLFVWENLL